MLVGAMMGAQLAQRGLAELAERLAIQVANRLPRQALTKYAVYNIAKQVARWIGISLTKRTFAGAVSKAVPIVGGVLSAGVTASMMWPMAKKLKNHLKGMRFAEPDDIAPGVAVAYP